MIRWLLSYLYAPLFFVGFVGAALGLVSAGVPAWTLPGLLVAAIAVSFLAERAAPYEEAWNHDKRDSVTNTLHAIVNEAALVYSVLLLPVLTAYLPGLDLWPHGWPLWWQLGLAIVIADFGITLAHYVSHRFEVLWRLHAVHHAAPRLYGFNGLMKHPLHQAIEVAAGTAPLVLLGVGQDIAWLLSFSVGIQLLLQHSNVDMRIGPLVYVWAAAPAHRHHHLASKTDGDVNFGLFTALWDHALGTFENGRSAPRDGEVGVDGRPDYPRGYLGHLIEPFRLRRKQ